MRPFEPLAIANCVSSVLGMPRPRCARPYARCYNHAAIEVDANDSRQTLVGDDHVDQTAESIQVVRRRPHGSQLSHAGRQTDASEASLAGSPERLDHGRRVRVVARVRSSREEQNFEERTVHYLCSGLVNRRG